MAIGDGASPEAFTTITERFSIPAVGGTKSLIDFSNHDTENIKDYQVADLAEGQELPVKCNMIPSDAAQDLVRTAYDNGTVNNWKVTFRGTPGKYRLFPAIVTHLDDDPSELDGRVVFNFTIKITGTITRG